MNSIEGRLSKLGMRLNTDEIDSDILEYQLFKIIGTRIWKIEQCE